MTTIAHCTTQSGGGGGGGEDALTTSRLVTHAWSHHTHTHTQPPGTSLIIEISPKREQKYLAIEKNIITIIIITNKCITYVVASVVSAILTFNWNVTGGSLEQASDSCSGSDKKAELHEAVSWLQLARHGILHLSLARKPVLALIGQFCSSCLPIGRCQQQFHNMSRRFASFLQLLFQN